MMILKTRWAVIVLIIVIIGVVYSGNKTFRLSTYGDPFYVGSAGTSNYCDCQIGDVIILNRAATTSELTQLNQFLAWKHGITI